MADIITRGGATQRFDTAEPPGPEWLEGPSQRLLRGLIGKTLTLQRSPRGVVQGVSGMEALWMQLAHVLPDEPFARQVLQVMRHAFSDEVLRSTFELASPVFPEAPVVLGETWKRPLDVSNTVMGRLQGMDTYHIPPDLVVDR